MEDRIALVIGNANYSNITRLKNPIQDATAIAASLGGLGFRLVEGRALLDANRLQIEQSIQQFVKELGRRAVGLFYFSGHGLQLGGANYVVPITAGATRETHIEADLVDVGRLLAGMEHAQTALNVLILDACRSDPFEGRSYRSTQGLAPMQARSGTIICTPRSRETLRSTASATTARLSRRCSRCCSSATWTCSSCSTRWASASGSGPAASRCRG